MPLPARALSLTRSPSLVQRLFAPLAAVVPSARFQNKPDKRRRVLDATSIVVSLVLLHVRRLASMRALIDLLDELPALGKTLGLAPLKRSTISDALTGSQKNRPDSSLRDFVHDVFRSLVQEVYRRNHRGPGHLKAFVAVDGSVFNATAKMVWCFFDANRNALKAHVGFDILAGIPRFIRLTCARTGERAQMLPEIRRGVTYVLDRGYVALRLFRTIAEKRAYWVTRLKDGMTYEVLERRTVTAEDRRRGILSDDVIRLGAEAPIRARLVTFLAPNGRPFQFITNLYELTPFEIAELYRQRWSVETFFKFLKHAMTTRHLIARTLYGIHIQLLTAAITYLLLVLFLAPARKPGDPPVTLSQMRRLADRLIATIVTKASPHFHESS